MTLVKASLCVARVPRGDIWHSLKHPNVLPFLGILETATDLYLVSPYVENGSLSDYIVAHPDTNRPRLLSEAAAAIAFLHECGIIHGDIKASNILVSDDIHALLCDFGLTRFSATDTSVGLRGVGTVRYQSPELLHDGERKTFESDVWALGITIYEVLSSRVPFEEYKTTLAIIAAIAIKDKLPPTRPSHSPSGEPYSAIWITATDCWQKDPALRPSMQSVYERLSTIQAGCQQKASSPAAPEGRITAPRPSDQTSQPPNATSGSHVSAPLEQISSVIAGMLSRYEVSLDRLALSQERNSSGEFAVVVRAKLSPRRAPPGAQLSAPRNDLGPTDVAVKMLNVEENTCLETIKTRAFREMHVWSQLQHDNIAKFVGSHFDLCTDPAKIWLISSWEVEGDLYKFLRSPNAPPPLDRMRLQINICHGDLKGENVLVQFHPLQTGVRAMLHNFGHAQVYDDEVFNNLQTENVWSGSIRWCSPEVLDGRRSIMDDIWALGWLAWEVITEKEPFYDCRIPCAVMKRICFYRLPALDSPPIIAAASLSPLRRRMKTCWHRDPYSRGTATECLQDFEDLISNFKLSEDELKYTI